MSERSQGTFTSTGTAPDQGHPAWCDRSLCTADPASQADGYRPDAGGEHRSATIPLDLLTCHWLPERAGVAWLTESVAPWPCSPYLRVRVGDSELAMSVDYVAPVLAALTALAGAALGEGQVGR